MPSETEDKIEMGTEDMELEDAGARRSEDFEEVLQLEGQEEEKGEDGDGNDKEKIQGNQWNQDLKFGSTLS
jgi:hypothetical protein